MKSEKDIYIEQYLSFTFNAGTPIYFSNHEVLGDVEYIPTFTPEIIKTESSKSFSIVRSQAEHFKFKISYHDVQTRRKINELFKAIQSAYTLSFSFSSFIAPFDQFPPILAPNQFDENKLNIATMSSSIVEFPNNFSYDKIGRGQGSEKIKDIEIRVYRAGVFVIPADPCTAMQAKSVSSQFSLYAWQEGGSSELLHVLIDLELSGDISSIDSWPSGSLYKDNVLIDFMNATGYIGTARKYEPENIPLPILDSSEWKLVISNMAVTLKTGESCTRDFEQIFGTPPGDFNNDFNNDFLIQ